LTRQGFVAGSKNSASVETVMAVEVLIFNCNGSLSHVGRELFKINGGAIFVAVDFVEEVAVSVQNFGRDGIDISLKGSGRGEVAQKKPVDSKS